MPCLSIDPAPAATLGPDVVGRAEGVAISTCGARLAVADATGNRVLVFVADKGLLDGPIELGSVIEGPENGVAYPHDVDFSPDGRLLAVANRTGASVALYERQPGPHGRFGPKPARVIDGKRSRLNYVDGVKFVPPQGKFVAAASLMKSRITFHRRGWLRRARYRMRPSRILRGPQTGLVQPDGIAFSPVGDLLAATNHGAGTVTVYARERRGAAFNPTPVAVFGLASSRLACPHSVAFSPDGSHLAISNAGGRTIAIYRREAAPNGPTGTWSSSPVVEFEACDPASFESTNSNESREGGPKGIALGADILAICTHAFGVRLHRVSYV